MTQDQRQAVLRIARTWQATPYHPHARVKGAGVDCLTLLAAVYEEAAVIPPVDLPAYSHQWHLHHGAELYLEGLLKYTREIEGPPLPGDICVWRFGRTFSHGAIVVEWPIIIHAYLGVGCIREDAEKARWLAVIGGNAADRGQPRPRKFFSPWEQ